METVDAPPRGRLREVALLFLKLGATAFGGPAVAIALMEEEVVRRRRWVTREEFLDLFGATNLIPGPNSTELAIHLGYRRAGRAGLLAAGACFILPAAVIVTLLAWVYARYGTLPATEGILRGVKPVVIVVVLRALWSLGRSALKTRTMVALAAATALAQLLGLHELLVLLGGGAAGLLLCRRRPPPASAPPPPGRSSAGLLLAPPLAAGTAAAAAAPGLGPLFLFFLKVGSVLYGSGYVLLAFIRADLVERWGWLTEAQVLDATAVGQVTPGPLFTTATFVGYLLEGLPGAGVATLGIFLPSFVFVALSGPLLPRLRRSAAAGAFLDGVNAASLALMAVVTGLLGRAALVDAATIGLAAVSLLLLLRWKVNPAWLLLGGAAAGLALGWA